MTPQETQLVIRTASAARLDRLDELYSAAWHGAAWGAAASVGKLPRHDSILTKRPQAPARALTIEEDIARWDRWAKSGPHSVREH